MPKAAKSEPKEKVKTQKKSAKPKIAVEIPAGSPVPKASKAKKTRTAKATTKKSLSSLGVARKRSRPGTDDIALRAYYIAERRKNMGWPGDEAGDWLEAERQLLAEASQGRR